MCYPKPGPRCTPHAKAILQTRKAAVDAQKTATAKDIARMRYEEAKQAFYTTAGGLDYLRKKVEEEGEENPYWASQLDRSEQARNISLAHFKARQQEEPTETHQVETEVIKDLGVTLDKSQGLPPGRYLDSIAPVEDFEAAYNAGLIDVRPHPDPNVPYLVLDYSRTAQYANAWNTVTVNARGLIVNKDTGEIISRPFRKFFNYNQPVEGLTEFDRSGRVVVTEKLDGSMGSLFTLPDGSMAISTRGSMDSTQARRATDIYNNKYAGKWNPDADTTYIYEVILPENRIVVNYGDTEDIALIGAIDKNTGRSRPLSEVAEWKGRRARQYEYTSYAQALGHKIPDNEEGVVVHFVDNDERVKLKGENYLQLHKIATNLTALGIWERVSTTSDDKWVADMPDEFANEVNGHITRLRSEHAKILEGYEKEAKSVRKACGLPDKGDIDSAQRKALVLYIQEKYKDKASLIIPLAVGGSTNNLSKSIWRALRPKGKQPVFGNVDEG